MREHPKSVLPGFGLSLGFSITFLALIVLIPISTIVLKSLTLNWSQFWGVVFSQRVLAALTLSFAASSAAALTNVACGLLLAWVLVRYRFPLRRVVDGLVDLPFALPTAVAGITFTSLYAESGFLGAILQPLNIQVAFQPLGVYIALTFVGLPFVVRTVQPVLEDLESELEEAAATSGAGGVQTFLYVILPCLAPALLSGFSLAFARGLGEYGSVVFISGNVPMRTEIVPLLIMTKLEQFDYAGATALALLMLIVSLAVLLMIQALEGRIKRSRQ